MRSATWWPPRPTRRALDTTNTTVSTKAALSDLLALPGPGGHQGRPDRSGDRSEPDSGPTDHQGRPGDRGGSTGPDSERAHLAGDRPGLARCSPSTTRWRSRPTRAALDATNAAMNNKADLVGGLVPTSQLPALAYTTTVVVGTKAAMLALSPTQVQPGDVCVITAGPDKGSYILNAADPTVFANWVQLSNPDAPVVQRQRTDRHGGARRRRRRRPQLAQRHSDDRDHQPDHRAGQQGRHLDDDHRAGRARPAPADVDARISQSSNNKPAAALVATSVDPHPERSAVHRRRAGAAGHLRAGDHAVVLDQQRAVSGGLRRLVAHDRDGQRRPLPQGHPGDRHRRRDQSRHPLAGDQRQSARWAPTPTTGSRPSSQAPR